MANKSVSSTRASNRGKNHDHHKERVKKKVLRTHWSPDDNHMKWIFLDYDNSKQTYWITLRTLQNAGQSSYNSMHDSSVWLSVSCDINFEHTEDTFFFHPPFSGVQYMHRNRHHNFQQLKNKYSVVIALLYIYTHTRERVSERATIAKVTPTMMNLYLAGILIAGFRVFIFIRIDFGQGNSVALSSNHIFSRLSVLPFHFMRCCNVVIVIAFNSC